MFSFLIMTEYKVEVDRQKCIGCGACAAQCPDNFEMETGDEFKARAKNPIVTELGCNMEAADICPVQAISVKKL